MCMLNRVNTFQNKFSGTDSLKTFPKILLTVYNKSGIFVKDSLSPDNFFKN